MEKEEALRKRAEKNKAKALEYARKAQAAAKALSEIERNDDLRRKIIDGAHIQTEALNNPEIAALLHRLRDEKVIPDTDRALFDLPLLSEEEKERRMTKRNVVRKRRNKLPEKNVARESADMEAA